MRVKTDEKRLEILQVAAKVFGQNGYHGASMSAISAELGDQKPLFMVTTVLRKSCLLRS